MEFIDIAGKISENKDYVDHKNKNKEDDENER